MLSSIQVSCAQCGVKVMSDQTVRGTGGYYCSIEHKAKWISDRKPPENIYTRRGW